MFTSLDVTVELRRRQPGHVRRRDGDELAVGGRTSRATTGAPIVNAATVAEKLRFGPAKPFCGEDMLVVTSPALKPAADTFANARKAAGYHPRVVVVGSDPGQIGTTRHRDPDVHPRRAERGLRGASELRRAVRRHLARPDLARAVHVRRATTPDCDIASDLPYSLNAPADLFADVMLGRIPAPDLDSANAVVNKIVGYETTPTRRPAGDDFYWHTHRDGVLRAEVPLHPQRGPDRRAELQVEERAGDGSLRARLHEPPGHARVHEDGRDDPQRDDRRRHHRGPRLYDASTRT